MNFTAYRSRVSKISTRTRLSKRLGRSNIKIASSIKQWQAEKDDGPSLPSYNVETKAGQHDDSDLVEIELGLERLQVSRTHSTRVQRFVQKTRPLVDAIQRYGTVLDVAANVSPEFMSPLWASLKALLNVFKGFEEYFSRLADTLQHIGDILPACQIYQQLFNEHESVQEAISSAYHEIQKFLKSATELFQSSGSVFRTSVWETFDQRFEQSLAQLRRWSGLVESRAELANKMENVIARKKLDDVEQKLSETMEKLTRTEVKLACVEAKLGQMQRSIDSGDRVPTLPEVRMWLNARQCHEEKSTLRRMTRGCDWILNHRAISDWIHQDHVQIFWIYGQPGCGKSFLYYKVLEYVEDSVQRPAVYFLFCEADRQRATASSLLRSWTLQLLSLLWRANPDSETLQRVKRQLACRNTREATSEEVSKLFLSLINANDMPTCFLTVDALDECSDAQDLPHLFSQIPKRFKILATSRDLPNTPPFTQNNANFRTLKITPNLTQHDIDNYLQTTVPTLQTLNHTPLPDHLQQLIITRLRNSNGMFLYIRLMIEHIQTQLTTSDIIQCFDHLPPTLTQRYDRIMAEITHQPDPHCLLAHKTIFWVLVAHRPLTSKELCAALAIRPACVDNELVYSDDRRVLNDDPKEVILRLCGSLIRPRGEEGILYPFHATVTQYLKSWAESIGLASEMAGFYGLPMGLDSEGIAAAVCMRYLSSSVVTGLSGRFQVLGGVESAEGILASGEKELDFLRYAVTQWFVHARFIDEGNELLLDIAERLLDGTSPNMEIIWRLYWFSGVEGSVSVEACPTEFSGLHIAAYFGLLQVVKRLLKSLGHSVRDGQGRTPLWWAAAREHEEVVRAFMEAGANMDLPGETVRLL